MKPRFHRRWICLRWLLAVLGPLLLQILLFPPMAWAGGCGVTEPGACMDGLAYSSWEGVASFLWAIDSMLLQLAYLIDVFRVWVTETVFASAYQVLTQIIKPAVVPFATVALLLGLFLFMLMPLVGRVRLMNVRHVLVWAVMAPLLLTMSGPLVVHVEQARVTVGASLFSEISQLAPGAIFGVAASDMRPAQSLYMPNENPCGTGALTRPGAIATTALRMDDLAAALLWADAEDIHCSGFAGPNRDLPDVYCLAAPEGPQFMACQDVGQMGDPNARTAALTDIKRGVTRLGLGIIPCLLAVLEACLQLLFGVALVLLWIALPISLLMIFFSDSAGSVVTLVTQGLGILKTTWATSVLLALLFAALSGSAAMGNAGAYIGFSLGALLLVGYLLVGVGLGAVGRSFAVLTSSVTRETGINLAAPLAAAGQAAVGVAKMATTGIAAYQQTGSGRYTAAALAGRFKPVAAMGEVLASWGAVDDPEVLHGLHAGQRFHAGGRAMRLAMQVDAKRTTAEGVTFREAAQERQIARDVAATQRDPWRQINAGGRAMVQSAQEGIQLLTNGQARQQMLAVRARVGQALGDRWQALRTAPANIVGEIASQIPNGGTPAVHAIQIGAVAAAVLHDRVTPDHRDAAYRLNSQQRMQRVSGAVVPSTAQTVAQEDANIPRLLREGHTVIQQHDGTVTYWKEVNP